MVLETVTRALTMLVINNRTNQDYIRCVDFAGKVLSSAQVLLYHDDCQGEWLHCGMNRGRTKEQGMHTCHSLIRLDLFAKYHRSISVTLCLHRTIDGLKPLVRLLEMASAQGEVARLRFQQYVLWFSSVLYYLVQDD